MLQIYNSLTRQKQLFKPIRPGKVQMYVCGNTVYDYCHIGHARSMLSFDMVYRYLCSKGYEVTYVRNITDIDDKIIQRANQNDESFTAVTERFIKAQNEDADALDILRPNYEPKATEHIDDIINLIQKLMAKGFAYVGTTGDVYYDVSQFKTYGKLSQQAVEKLRTGVRIEVNEAKDDPLDFVLWKLAKPGEPSWQSPWGEGRPGWHIECSAMSMALLGENFDIHGGGGDLIFPHHENEVAQSEAATGCQFANVWMHAGLVQVNKEKMSKSLGNFFTIRDVLAKYPAEVIRYLMLSSHYRSPINYSEDTMEQAQAALTRLYTALRGLPRTKQVDADVKNAWRQQFNAAMDDDFNTPVALAVLFELVRDINRLRDHQPEAAMQMADELRYCAGILGLLQQDPEAYLRLGIAQTEIEPIEQLIAERQQARQLKDWAKADLIRKQLTEMGIDLEDGPQGTTWRRI
ncbi:MAG: cysteinyl-tRNA synthetase [Gammaproteobacteria bacterium]|jgi:cysteinyl-tRNA synthetase|nr:cysteinyl-tRNA synthetase [Gammaproteobacteria bacterium]